jgi:hypothetical protein
MAMAMNCQTQANRKIKQSEAHGMRRRSNSRGARRGMNFGSTEMDELVMASTLVPTCCNAATSPVLKPVADFETASTAPPSAEQSPELSCMVDEADSWPSLREAVESGWDFCSEAADSEEFWEDLPEPALSIEGLEAGTKSEQSQEEGATSWLIVREGESTSASNMAPTDEVATKATFADMLRERLAREDEVKDGLLPAASGASMPALRARPVQRRSRSAVNLSSTQELTEEDEQFEMHIQQWHGWKKEHKATWSAKQQRKVAERQAQRISQSWKSRGWLEEDAEAQDEV